MNNVKLRGREATVAGLTVRGLKWARKPKHTKQDLVNLKGMKAEALKRRSKNRQRRELTTQSKRRNRK